MQLLVCDNLLEWNKNNKSMVARLVPVQSMHVDFRAKAFLEHRLLLVMIVRQLGRYQGKDHGLIPKIEKTNQVRFQVGEGHGGERAPIPFFVD